MKSRLSLLIVLALFFSACHKDVDLELPAAAPRLGVHAIWNRNQQLEVQVTRTFSVTETPSFDWQTDPATIDNKRKKYSVENARVLIYRNGVFYDELVFDPQTYLYKTASAKLATPDAEYQVKVAAPGFAEVTSPIARFLAQVPIKNIEVKKQVAANGVSGMLDEVVIEFDDPAATKNFYWITVERKYTGTSPHNFYSWINVYPMDNEVVIPSSGDISTEMPSVPGDKLLLSDANFNGQTRRLALRMSSWELQSSSSMEVTISLNNATEDLYKYIRTRLLDVDNPFSTPVQAYTNITNGVGIFGLYAGDKRQLQ